MATDRNKDQKPRGEDLRNNGPKIELQETARRLQMAECVARGGHWQKGSCYVNPPKKGEYQ